MIGGRGGKEEPGRLELEEVQLGVMEHEMRDLGFDSIQS